MTAEVPAAPGGDILVYVDLFDEGVDVQRPALAVKEGEGFRLPSEAPEGENWAMPPGSLVRYELIHGDLRAVAQL